MWTIVLISAAALAIILIAVVAILWRRSRAGPDFYSCVLMQNEPRTLTDADLRAAYRRAFAVEPTVFRAPDAPSPPGKTESRAQMWTLTSPSIPPLAFINSAVPYMNEQEAAGVADKMESKPGRAAILGHRAWFSIDTLGARCENQEQVDMVHTLLAKLAAEVYDDNCVLLYLKESNQLALPGPKVESQLKTGQLKELFGNDDLHAPMYNFERGDPAVDAAMTEAKSRLPEFVQAFKTRGTDTSKPFLFKAQFKPNTDPEDSTNEYIWLLLQSIDSSGFRGTIENHPIGPAVPPKGSVVTVPPERVVDWAYIGRDNKPVGMFVDRVLVKQKR